MRYFIHIVTANERIRDPEGAEFDSLASARDEASRSARDLMADELRAGRTLPLGWLVQIEDETERIAFTIKFATLVLGGAEASWRPPMFAQDLALIERAKATFAKARKNHAEIKLGLDGLRNEVRKLAQYSAALEKR